MNKTGYKIIQKYVATLDSSPGVYRMLDDQARVLYVGKARNLKARVSNYARPTGHSARIARMILETASMMFLTTRTQTEALLGVRVGWGIYFNYLFVVTWLADAIWMLVASSHYRNRNRWIQLGLYGYLVFIAFNGAAVFASGWIRWATLAMLVGWLAWILRTRNRFLKGTSDHTRTPRNVP